jgi:hypothetical protein
VRQGGSPNELLDRNPLQTLDRSSQHRPDLATSDADRAIVAAVASLSRAVTDETTAEPGDDPTHLDELATAS